MNRPLRVILALVLATVRFCSAALAQNAPMFRGNLQHAGVYNSAGVPSFNQIKWRFHTNGRVISSPAIVDGVVYFGSTDSNLFAVDAQSGKLKWKFETGSWSTSSPAVASGIVYFGSEVTIATSTL
jgi:eukaryotic-like serine/threonine-protein kinase